MKICIEDKSVLYIGWKPEAWSNSFIKIINWPLVHFNKKICTTEAKIDLITNTPLEENIYW